MRSTAPGRPRRSSWRMSSEPIGGVCRRAHAHAPTGAGLRRRGAPAMLGGADPIPHWRPGVPAADARGASGRVHSAPETEMLVEAASGSSRTHPDRSSSMWGPVPVPSPWRSPTNGRTPSCWRPISRRRPWSSRDAMPTGSACGSRFAGDLLMPVRALSGRIDLVVSNPPYVALDRMDDLPAEVRAEPALRSPATSRSTSGWPSRPRTRCARAAASRSRSQRIAAGMSPT